MFGTNVETIRIYSQLIQDRVRLSVSPLTKGHTPNASQGQNDCRIKTW